MLANTALLVVLKAPQSCPCFLLGAVLSGKHTLACTNTQNISELLQYGFGVQFSCMAHPQMGNTNLMCPNKAVLANTHLWDIIKARQIISRSFFDSWRSNNVHRNGCAGQYNSVRYTYGAPKLFGESVFDSGRASGWHIPT